MEFQKTLAKEIKIEGIGLHSGETVHLRLRPATAGSGIKFKRVDLKGSKTIDALVHNVVDTSLATVLGVGEASVSTIEHCMAALYALGVDNALIEIDGPETPIMDGSSQPFVEAIGKAGLKTQSMLRRVMRIDKPVRVECGDKFSILRPFDGFRITYSIDFGGGFPGEQHYVLDVTPESFSINISRARTFGFVHEVEMLRSMGKARGASMDNAVALDGNKVLNPDGLRMPDEMVRHKMLDAVGDLALAGAGIRGHLIVHKGGHELHRKLVSALLERTDAWSLVKPSARPSFSHRKIAAAAAAVHA